MRKLIVVIIFALLTTFVFASIADAAVRVRGYYRSNGTYVAPHYRSNPDGNFYNNWSAYPNINPYTGQTGTKLAPTYRSYYTPSYYTPSYYRSYYGR